MTLATRVSRHEAVMLILYSIAPLDLRQRIDDELFAAWARMPCGIDPDSPVGAPHRLAVQRLHAAHLVGRPLTLFTQFWGLVEEKDGR